MGDGECGQAAEEMERHGSDLRGVSVSVPQWQAGHNHICITNRFHLKQ
jgi:hypothetical protein